MAFSHKKSKSFIIIFYDRIYLGYTYLPVQIRHIFPQQKLNEMLEKEKIKYILGIVRSVGPIKLQILHILQHILKKKMYHSFLFESSTPLILVNSQSQPDYVNEAELGTTTYSDFCSECKICKTRIGERGKKQQYRGDIYKLCKKMRKNMVVHIVLQYTYKESNSKLKFFVGSLLFFT